MLGIYVILLYKFNNKDRFLEIFDLSQKQHTMKNYFNSWDSLTTEIQRTNTGVRGGCVKGKHGPHNPKESLTVRVRTEEVQIKKCKTCKALYV